MINQGDYGHYSMILEWDPRDDIYIATVPELPGCRTHGETIEEAARHGREAMESWIDSARKWGDPIPSPKLFVPVAADARDEAALAVG